jgi:amino acid transporter
MNIDNDHGTTVLRRDSDYTPKRSFRTWLIGRPLSTADAPHQLSVSLSVSSFGLDALYQQLRNAKKCGHLAVLGTSLSVCFSASIGIVALLAIVSLSYEQTIHAFRRGGAYIVSRDNLGELPAKFAAAALLTDYVLTVAVSISSGVAQIISAAPGLYPYRVILGVALVAFIMIVNLRGVKESGAAFAFPTYFFLLAMYITVAVGLVRFFSGSLGVVQNPPEMEILNLGQTAFAFLILRAFSSGTAALTGVEAISNGIPAFKEPRSKNAGRTLVIMASILGSLMLGISFLSAHIQAVPSELKPSSRRCHAPFLTAGASYIWQQLSAPQSS